MKRLRITFVILFLAGCTSIGAIAQSNVQTVPGNIQKGGIEPVNSNNHIVQGALAPPVYPKFLSYPTSHSKPPFIDSGSPASDQLLYDLRLQHWYFLFDQGEYVQRYGALPENLPGGVTASEYASNPPARSFSQDLEDYINGNATQSGSQQSTH